MAYLQASIKKFIKWGPSLYKDEYEMKVFYMNLGDEITELDKLPFVCDYLIRTSSEVGSTKREIIEHIRGLDEKYANLTFERTRLRYQESYFKSPGKILLDDQKLFDIVDPSMSLLDWCIELQIMENAIIIQKLPSNEARLFDCDGRPIDNDCRSVFVARLLLPRQETLTSWSELILGKTPRFKSLLSNLSGIPENDVKYRIIGGPVYTMNKYPINFFNEFFFDDINCINESPEEKSEEYYTNMVTSVEDGDGVIFKDRNERPSDEQNKTKIE